jgi:hypothetical protein
VRIAVDTPTVRFLATRSTRPRSASGKRTLIGVGMVEVTGGRRA